MRRIPQSIKEKIDKQNQTIYENADPKMQVVFARARSSIRDSSYFTIEKIREEEGLSNVAVIPRRLKPIGPPDRIYNIYIKDDIAKTAIREYPDRLKEHWKYQFDVAPAKDVSIAFDGRYHLNSYKKWGLVTDEKPWIFWVGLDNKLYGRIWDETFVYELAEDVEHIDSIRGWIPAQTGHTDDQGLIVAYVKTDGKVYYRNYCLQITRAFFWEVEREIPELGDNCLGIRLFRANDFRIGFIAEKTNGNIMSITDRNWAGMSIENHTFVGRVDVGLEFNHIKHLENMNDKHTFEGAVESEIYLCPPDVSLEIVDTARETNSEVILTISANYPLESTKEINIDEFKLLVAGVPKSIDSIEIIDSNITITTNEGVGATQDVTVNYTPTSPGFKAIIDDYCSLFLEEFTIIDEGVIQDGYTQASFRGDVDVDLRFNQLEFINNDNDKHNFEGEVEVQLFLYDLDDAPV